MLRRFTYPRIVIVTGDAVVQTDYLRMIHENRRYPSHSRRMTLRAYLACCNMRGGLIRPSTSRRVARLTLAVYVIVVDRHNIFPCRWWNRVTAIALIGS